MIDLIFVGNPNRFVCFGTEEFGVSDHSIVFAIKKAGIKKSSTRMQEERSYKQYRKEMFENDVSNIPWHVIETFEDINDAVAAWNSFFIDVANRHAPIRKMRSKVALTPWISAELKELTTERNYALKIAKRPGDQEQWRTYRRLKNFTNRKLKSAEALYYKELITSAVDTKEMWCFLNKVIGSNKNQGSPVQRKTFCDKLKRDRNKVLYLFCVNRMQSR